jgi:hypothetical protein
MGNIESQGISDIHSHACSGYGKTAIKASRQLETLLSFYGFGPLLLEEYQEPGPHKLRYNKFFIWYGDRKLYVHFSKSASGIFRAWLPL